MTSNPSRDSVNGGDGVVKNDDLVVEVERRGESGLVVYEEEDRKDRNLEGGCDRENEEEFVSCDSMEKGDVGVKDDSVKKDDSFVGVEMNVNNERSWDLGLGEVTGICVQEKRAAVQISEVEDDQKDQNQDVNGDRGSKKLVSGVSFVEKGDYVAQGDEDVENDSEPSSYLDKEGQKMKVKEQGRLENDEKSDVVENDLCIRYCFLLQGDDKTRFSVDDLVWGKVMSHPWWPGQIFDPKHASEMALKCQKKNCFLVAYFGDKTFAWVPESQLKPFQTCFPAMVKQSSLVTFVNAVNNILEEVTRQVELGMACRCLGDEAYASLKVQKLENAGIQNGTCRAAVDRSMFVNTFRPKSLLEYVWALAQCPFGEFDRLELTIATAQLKDFYHSKGRPELPVFAYDGGLMENDAGISLDNSKSGKDRSYTSTVAAASIKSEKRPKGRRLKNHLFVEHDDDDGIESLSKKKEEIASSVKSGKRLRGRPRKNNISEDGSDQKNQFERMEDVDKHRYKPKYVARASSKKRRVVDSSSADLGKSQKEEHGKILDLDFEPPSSTGAKPRPTKIGDRIRRALSQLNVSSLNLKSSHETLQQLYLLASDPMQEYDFLPFTIGLFTKFKDSNSSSFSEDQQLGKLAGRISGSVRKVVNSENATSEMPEHDSMQDSYWSDLILQNGPDKETASKGRKRKASSQKQGQSKKTETNDKQVVEGRRIISGLEDIKGETPTALILSFSESDALPSAADLIKIFSPYGPLREEEIEILRKSSRAKVVFRYCHDAEKAYSSAGKYSIFGPALVSYRLRYSPPPKSSPGNSLPINDAAPIDGGNLEPQDQEGTAVADDDTRAEALQNRSFE